MLTEKLEQAIEIEIEVGINRGEFLQSASLGEAETDLFDFVRGQLIGAVLVVGEALIDRFGLVGGCFDRNFGGPEGFEPSGELGDFFLPGGG